MATKARTPKAAKAPATVAPATVAPTVAPVAPVAPAAPANPFAALVQAPATVAPTVAPKVHVLATAQGPVKAANHVATFKGTRPVTQGGTTYALTGLPYNAASGHVNAVQWQAVQAAMAANGGQATVGQVAAAFADAGLPAGLAQGFLAYRAKGAKPNVAIVA